MITCESFRNRFEAGTEDPAVLEHLRTCDRCLDFAAHSDPDVMFRALGFSADGEELVPPGGIEAFVDDVMQQVRVRGAESTVSASHNVVSWPRRFAVAATLAAAVTGTMFYKTMTGVAGSPAAPFQRAEIRRATGFATKPVIETYESQNATILEVPSDDDVKIVMIFDENLPADL